MIVNKKIDSNLIQIIDACTLLANYVSKLNIGIENFIKNPSDIHSIIKKYYWGNIENAYRKIMEVDVDLKWPLPYEIKRKKVNFVKFLEYSKKQGHFGEGSFNLVDHIFLNIIEECNETSQRATKCLRFGYKEKQPGQDFNNFTRLRHEFADLIASIEMLMEVDYIEEDIGLSSKENNEKDSNAYKLATIVESDYPNRNGDIYKLDAIKVKEGIFLYDEKRRCIGEVQSFDIQDGFLTLKVSHSLKI